MKKALFWVSPALIFTSFVFGDTLFSPLIEVKENDSDAEIVSKAAHVIPSPRQLDYHRREFIGFIHFGPNTFTGKEWGNGMESPQIFAPKGLDTDQWCETMKAAGITKVVMTFKHHDGYVLWQSRYEPYQSIKNSPFLNGKADLAKELSKSCAKYGLKFGVYLSPADLYQIESKNGLYGNGSKSRKSIIPTDPTHWLTDPTKLRKDKVKQAPVFEFECDDYNRYMLNQLYEMLTEYGPVHEVWFDGAHPKSKGNQKYTYQQWYQLIRKLAPEAVIFGKGPDSRWCGNEAGKTRQSEWNVLPLSTHPDQSDWPDFTAEDLGSRAMLKGAKYLYYSPAETNTSLRAGWFWRNDSEQGVRTADDTFDIYERSVGGNSIFMLNVPPNQEGKFSERDVACLKEVGRRIRNTYGVDLANGAEVSATGLQDGKLETYWQPQGEQGEILLKLPQKTRVNRFMLQEAITQRGQRIEKHALDAKIEGQWQELATGTTVGYKKILRFPAVETQELRLRILESRLQPSVAEISLHYYDQPPLPVESLRDASGKIVLQLKEPKFQGKGGGHKTQGLKIHYTLDGTEPTRRAPLYTAPISLPDGGVIKAKSFSDKQDGEMAIFEIGPDTKTWKVTASSEESAEYAADKAVDGNPKTFWQTAWSGDYPKHPHVLTLDFGRELRVKAFTYLPRQDKAVPDGMIEKGNLEVSTDGKNWIKVGEFEFGNLLNDPTMRRFDLPQAQKAKYLRVISLEGAQSKPYAGAAEIGVLTH